jgi:hypothetical protein
MSTFVEDTSAVQSGILNMAFSLEGLASSFYDTGNEMIGDRLGRYAERLHEMRKDLSDAVGKEVTRQVHKSHDMSTAVFEAALVGAGFDIRKSDDEVEIPAEPVPD